jgi:hypothetical protein
MTIYIYIYIYYYVVYFPTFFKFIYTSSNRTESQRKLHVCAGTYYGQIYSINRGWKLQPNIVYQLFKIHMLDDASITTKITHKVVEFQSICAIYH